MRLPPSSSYTGSYGAGDNRVPRTTFESRLNQRSSLRRERERRFSQDHRGANPNYSASPGAVPTLPQVLVDRGLREGQPVQSLH